MASPIDPAAAKDDTPLPSERSFGLVFAAVFAVMGVWPLVRRWDHPRVWPLVAAAVFAILAVGAPRVLRPLNVAWFWIGLLLHKIVSPLVMGAVFFFCMAPIGLLMRALGKRPLALDRDPAAVSYWITRDPPGPKPDTLRNQF